MPPKLDVIPALRVHQAKIWAALALLLILYLPTTGWPALSGLNPAQVKTVLILLLAAVLWVSEWLPLFLVSFIILALELLWLTPAVAELGHTVSDALFFAPFFSNIILLFLGGFVLSSIMQKAGLDARFAHWILRVTQGEPATTLAGIMAACAFLSMWMSNTATTAMMLTMVLPLANRLRADTPFRVGLILSIPLACNLGGIGTPIGTPPNAIAMSYLATKGIQVSFLEWMILTLPFLLLALTLLWFALLKVYPPGTDKLAVWQVEAEPLKARQWISVGIFVITVLGWLIGGQFGLKTGTVALFPIIAAFWLGILDQGDFRALPWDVLFMVAGGIALGVAIDITDLGTVIVGWLPSSGSFQMLVGILVLVTALLGTVMSNTATAGLLIPLVVSLSLPTNQLLVLILAITLNCSTAMILPVSTPPNAIAFGSGVIRVGDMARMGTLMVVLGVVTAFTIGPLYWFLIIN
ncbi:DASS family sodium-coupled anion symporter [Reinekea sp.]|uniref:SLC13 family permease n=1 Tax=Reinekea sp. TaxID=1970455 RepID=UPI002A7FE5AD|nr:DASS family sodium-coupled anion symporter [Reinekea sp.]